MKDEKRELGVSASGDQAIRVISAGQEKALATFDGQLGVHITRIVPDMSMWPSGLQQASFRFVIVGEDGLLLLATEEVTVEVGQTALLNIQHKGKGVGVEWLQELDLKVNGQNALALVQAALATRHSQ